jgi:serine/threonine protein kinase
VPGETVGPFQVLELLGHGSTGDVYLATDTRNGRQVALKRPSDEWLEQPDAARRLREEAQAAAGLNHPRLAAVREIVEVDGRPLVVMDYVAGEPLQAVLGRGRLTVEQAVAVAIDVAEAIAAAHAAGVVHRDLKPSNVCVTPEGRATVLDIGLAKIRPPSPDTDVPRPIPVTLAEGRRFFGTPGYAAPEQLTGRSVDQRSDVYALGVLLFEMVTGRRPFQGSDPAELALSTITEPVPSARRLNPGVPSALDAVIARLLAKNPKERYQNGPLVAADLKQIQRALGERPTLPLDEQWAVANPTAHRPRTPSSRTLVIAAVVLLALMALAVFIAR